jgi:formamidopyrimidine-DNA glycosylase
MRAGAGKSPAARNLECVVSGTLAHMPELPEVETIARGLNRRLAGDRIAAVWIGPKPEPLKSSAAAIHRVLCGARIEGVRRLGKHIVCDLASAAGPAQWIVHLGMSGRCLVCSPEAERRPHTHLIASLESGRELRFVDPRRFGRLEVLRGRKFAAPGEEPTSAARERFVELFRGRRTPIKSALLNQRLLAGLGNIYADESLFRAGVRPQRRVARMTRAELGRLYEAIRQVLAEAIAAGGSSISDYVDADGESGLFQMEHRVYRRTGEACVVCGARIQRTVIAGRSSHYCPNCQR